MACDRGKPPSDGALKPAGRHQCDEADGLPAQRGPAGALPPRRSPLTCTTTEDVADAQRRHQGRKNAERRHQVELSR